MRVTRMVVRNEVATGETARPETKTVEAVPVAWDGRYPARKERDCFRCCRVRG